MINDKYVMNMFNAVADYNQAADKIMLHLYRSTYNNFIGFDVIAQHIDNRTRLLYELDTACSEEEFNNIKYIFDQYFNKHIYLNDNTQSHIYYEWELNKEQVNKFIKDYK